MKKQRNNNPEFVEWFRKSSPYIHAHRGKVFVLSFGGEALTDVVDVGRQCRITDIVAALHLP